MSETGRFSRYVVIMLIVFGVSKAAVKIEENGLQPEDVMLLKDNSSYTCTAFVADKPQHTQIFSDAVCTTDQMSVTLVGRDMKCDPNMYVVGLKGADVGKPLNKWRKCKPISHTASPDDNEWCVYDCHCTGGCEQVMVLRWPKALTDSTWTLCDISLHCDANCPDIPCYNGGTCGNEGCLCPAFCQGDHCQVCAKDPYPPQVGITIGSTTFNVIMDDGWIIVLRRRDQTVDFDYERYWVDYENGFGDLSGEFWLGNKYLHLLTNNGSSYRCRVEFLTEDKKWLWAEYDTFSVGSATDNYRLHVAGYDVSSTAEDAWTGSQISSGSIINNYQFSTQDRDHDTAVINCADEIGGGWWHHSCSLGVLTATWGGRLRWNLIRNLGYVDFMIKVI